MTFIRRRFHALALLAAVAAAAGCRTTEPTALEELAATSPATGVKVLLLGLDGASLSVMRPLLSEGRLPRFRRLIDSGSHGVLRSQDPMRSPALWTTVATGHQRSVHGVLDFQVQVPGEEGALRLVSSRDRRSLALWNLMGPLGRTVGFAGWWATWPAEPVSGWMISDRMTRSRWGEWTDGAKQTALTYPSALAEDLQSLVVDPLDPPLDEIRELVQLSPGELEELVAARQPVYAHWLSVFKFAYCSQRSFEEMFLSMLSAGQPDLAAVLLIANDPISHTFWHFYRPESFGQPRSARADRLGRLIPGIYEHNDRYLGRVFELIDPDTVVIALSDHGLRASGKLPRPVPSEQFAAWFAEQSREAARTGTVAIGQSGRHSLNGLWIASGGPIRSGVELQATLLDITPTVLALLGLPVAEDMPGRVLEEILEPDFLKRYPVRRIPSYEHIIDRRMLRVDGEAEDERMIEMLRSLGYIG